MSHTTNPSRAARSEASHTPHLIDSLYRHSRIAGCAKTHHVLLIHKYEFRRFNGFPVLVRQLVLPTTMLTAVHRNCSFSHLFPAKSPGRVGIVSVNFWRLYYTSTLEQKKKKSNDIRIEFVVGAFECTQQHGPPQSTTTPSSGRCCR